MTIGQRLKRLREKRNLGQKEIACYLDMSDSGYSCYENDIRMPTTINVIKLAKYYNVTTDYILGIEIKPSLSIIDVNKRVQELEKQIIEFKNFIEHFKQL